MITWYKNLPRWRANALLLAHWDIKTKRAQPVNQSTSQAWLAFVLMSQCRNNNELALQHGGFCAMWSFVAKGLFREKIRKSRHVWERLELVGLKKNARKLKATQSEGIKSFILRLPFSSHAPHRFCYSLSYKYSYQCSPIKHMQRPYTSRTCTMQLIGEKQGKKRATYCRSHRFD